MATKDEIFEAIVYQQDEEIKMLKKRIEQLEAQKDFARRLADARKHTILWFLNELDCRIDHGADSNGHLEGVKELLSAAFYENDKIVPA